MKFVLGVDEAGRGPLAGPVAVGVIRAPEGFDIRAAFPGVGDSKALSEKERERIYGLLETQDEVQFCVRFGSAARIDAVGISKVIRNAVASGVRSLAPDAREACVLLDGSLKAPSEYAQQTIIKGDATEPAISLASIVAKVRRDRLMLRLARSYPEYLFHKHKGYGTALHYQCLKEHGPSAIHRRSYLPVEYR